MKSYSTPEIANSAVAAFQSRQRDRSGICLKYKIEKRGKRNAFKVQSQYAMQRPKESNNADAQGQCLF